LKFITLITIVRLTLFLFFNNHTLLSLENFFSFRI
jgi:hypothetical protein